MAQLKAQQPLPAGTSSPPGVASLLSPRPPLALRRPRTGREMLQALRANGFVGAWADREDIGDSVEFARQLRERVWSRKDE
jgi:hypothetical protein